MCTKRPIFRIIRFFLLRKMDAPLDFDLELAKKHSLENPVYYIQYGHARVSNILENAKEQKVNLSGPADLSLLTAPEELALFRLFREFSGTIRHCAKGLEPFGLVSYLQELAESFQVDKLHGGVLVSSVNQGAPANRGGIIRGDVIIMYDGEKVLSSRKFQQMVANTSVGKKVDVMVIRDGI